MFSMHVTVLLQSNGSNYIDIVDRFLKEREIEISSTMILVAQWMHTTLYSQYCDMHVSLNMHESCMQHAHYMQEISTRVHTDWKPHQP